MAIASTSTRLALMCAVFALAACNGSQQSAVSLVSAATPGRGSDGAGAAAPVTSPDTAGPAASAPTGSGASTGANTGGSTGGSTGDTATGAAPADGTATPALEGKQVEQLDRAALAVPMAKKGMLISWRLLATDASGIAFNVYRNGTRLNASPISDSTNFADAAGTAADTYTVTAMVGGVETGDTLTALSLAQPFLRIPLQQPPGGVTPAGEAYTYRVGDGSAADFDGDGQYELVVKWEPTNNHDNSQAGYTGSTLLDAYRLDGTRLWRIDLGRNIRSGAHYTTFLAYDFDGDGKAELMVKTADGTVDGTGNVVGDASADYRTAYGYILSGPEYLTVFNGMTGAAMATTSYLPARGDPCAWGDCYGGRVDRFLGGVAYLDGQRPSAVFSRGYYTRAVLVAWDWRDGKLTSRWTYDSDEAGTGPSARGQGAHYFAVADVDGDGKDDIVYGAATIADNGTLKCTTGFGHGDALHVGRFDPSNPHLMVVMPHEGPVNGVGFEMHDGATCEVKWTQFADYDVGRALAADIDPNSPGVESWSFTGALVSPSGAVVNAAVPVRKNFAVWWDGDLGRELFDRSVIDKWEPATAGLTRLATLYSYGGRTINSTKETPVLQADLLGDWREEVVLNNEDSTALLVFPTTLPTSYRLPTLMQDPQYRVQVASQNAGYNQPPNPGFFLGYGMATPAWAKVHMAK